MERFKAYIINIPICFQIRAFWGKDSLPETTTIWGCPAPCFRLATWRGRVYESLRFVSGQQPEGLIEWTLISKCISYKFEHICTINILYIYIHSNYINCMVQAPNPHPNMKWCEVQIVILRHVTVQPVKRNVSASSCNLRTSGKQHANHSPLNKNNQCYQKRLSSKSWSRKSRK